MKNNSIGFFALWKNKNSEYKATSEEELETTIKISECFQFAKSKNILIHGLYLCRWSSEYQYFTFWEVPDLKDLNTVIKKLEKAGDFKFAKSYHLIGHINKKIEKGQTGNEKYSCILNISLKNNFKKIKIIEQLDSVLQKKTVTYFICDSKSTSFYDLSVYFKIKDYQSLLQSINLIFSNEFNMACKYKFYLGVFEKNFRFGRNYQNEIDWGN